MLKKFNEYFEAAKNFAGLAVLIVICWLAIVVVNDYRLNLKQNRENLIAEQKREDFKVYSDNSANSNVETINKKDIEKIAKEIFNKEVLTEIKQQNEKIKAIHTVITNLNQTVQNMESANIDENQIWGSDDKLDWFLTRKNPQDAWKMDYTVHEDFKFTLLETEYGGNNILKFRVKMVDKVTGKSLPIKSFETKLDEKLFLKERTPRWEIYTGVTLNLDLRPEMIIGVRKGKWSVFGTYGQTDANKSFGVMRHFTVF